MSKFTTVENPLEKVGENVLTFSKEKLDFLETIVEESDDVVQEEPLKGSVDDPSRKEQEKGGDGDHLKIEPIDGEKPEEDEDDEPPSVSPEEMVVRIDSALEALAEAKRSLFDVRKLVTPQKKKVYDARVEAANYTEILKPDLKKLDDCISRPEKAIADLPEQMRTLESKLREGRDLASEDMDASGMKVYKAALPGVLTDLDEVAPLVSRAKAVPKMLGNVDSGVAFVKKSVERLDGLKQRLTSIDGTRIDETIARGALVGQVDGCGATDDQKMVLKGLVMATKVPAPKVANLLRKINGPKTGKKGIEMLRKKSQGSDWARVVFAQCQELMTDVYRYYSKPSEFTASLSDGGLKAKFDKVVEAASADYVFNMASSTEVVSGELAPTDDVGAPQVGPSKLSDDQSGRDEHTGPKLEIPKSKPDPKVAGRKIGIVGGGPVGLLAAIETSMKGGKTVVYEARGGASNKALHNRSNCIKLDEPTMQRLKRVGVSKAVEAAWDKGNHAVPVGVLETLLLQRAKMGGVAFVEGKTVQDAVKDDDGKVKLTFSDATTDVVQLLVVAAGAGFARGGGTLAKDLGFEVVKVESGDYAVTGVFEPKDNPDGGGEKETKIGWEYGFTARDVSYLVAQLSKEQFEAIGKDKEALKKVVAAAAIRMNMGGRDSKSDPLAFPIDIQQAISMVSDKAPSVVIGDSAATPHPSTSRGLNTGTQEVNALSTLLDNLEGNSDEAMAAYDWEVKRNTDAMVALGVRTMVQDTAASYNGASFKLKSTARKKKREKDKDIDAFANKVDTKLNILKEARQYALDQIDEGGDEGWELANKAISFLRESTEKFKKLTGDLERGGSLAIVSLALEGIVKPDWVA